MEGIIQTVKALMISCLVCVVAFSAIAATLFFHYRH